MKNTFFGNDEWLRERDQALKSWQKVSEMIVSDDPEIVGLGYEICKKQYPAVYASMINMCGVGKPTKEMLTNLLQYPEVNIGTVVRYRGLIGGPDMVVIHAMAETVNIANSIGYTIKIKCKYFNKSKQEFSTIEDRVECFEVVDQTKT